MMANFKQNSLFASSSLPLPVLMNVLFGDLVLEEKITVLWLNYTPLIWQFELERLGSAVNSVFVFSNSSIFEVKIRAASSFHAIESLSC